MKSHIDEIDSIYRRYLGMFISSNQAISEIGAVLRSSKKQVMVDNIRLIDLTNGEVVLEIKDADTYINYK